MIDINFISWLNPPYKKVRTIRIKIIISVITIGLTGDIGAVINITEYGYIRINNDNG